MAARKDDLFLMHELVVPRKARLVKNPDDLNALKKIADWTRDFVAAPHEELGKKGRVVCPFVPTAIQDETLWFAIEHVKGLSPLQVAHLVEEYKDLFLSLDPKEENGRGKAEYKTILIIFPDLPMEKAAEYIDGVQRPLKDVFVKRGLMLGDFHPFSDSKGIHNPDFRPLRSPIPMLVIRHMVVSDWFFLLEKPEWLQAWFARFHGGDDPKRFLEQVERLTDAMKAIREQKKA